MLDASLDRLLGVMRGLSSEQLVLHPAPDRWSVAENLEHIIFTETFALSRLEEAGPPRPDAPTSSQWDGRDEPLMRLLAEARGDRWAVPDAFRPIGRWPVDAPLAEFDAARTRSRAFAASMAADCAAASFDIPRPGSGTSMAINCSC
jgi:hypothetical protein